MAAYEDWAKALRLAWMGDNARAIVGGFASVLGDKAVEWAKQALRQHLPLDCDEAALELIGSGRGLYIGSPEDVGDFRVRLTRYIEQWKRAGTPLGLLYALHVDGMTNAVLVQQNGLGYYLDEILPDDPVDGLNIVELAPNPEMDDHPWFTFDFDTDFCSRFALLFPDSNGLTGTQITSIRRMLRDWKPAKATCDGIYDCTAGRFWDWPPATWADLSVLDWGDSVVTRYDPA